MNNNYLSHYGVLGMKWGVRRNRSSGSLSPLKKRIISNKYKKYAKKGAQDLANNYDDLYVKSYNKAVDKVNLVSSKKKLSNKQMLKMFEDEANNIMLKNIYDFNINNKYYKKSEELAKKYDMYSWDDLAKQNREGYEAAKRALNKSIGF